NGGVLYLPGARTNSWMFGLTAPVGAAGSLFGSVQQMIPGGDLKDLTSTSTMTVASLGYTYNLSKRTNLYGYYSYVNNVAMVEDTKSNSIGVGVRHKF
ncbi:MAG: porin, partial [Orrella sp.]